MHVCLNKHPETNVHEYTEFANSVYLTIFNIWGNVSLTPIKLYYSTCKMYMMFALKHSN